MHNPRTILLGLAVTAVFAAVAVWHFAERGSGAATGKSQIADSKASAKIERERERNNRQSAIGNRKLQRSSPAVVAARDAVLRRAMAARDAVLRRAMAARGAGEVVRCVVGIANDELRMANGGARAGQSSASANGRSDVRARDLALNKLTRKAAAADVAALRDFLKLHDDGGIVHLIPFSCAFVEVELSRKG